MRENVKERKQIGALLDVELYRQMRAAAALQGRTVSDVLEDAMRNYLTQNSRKKS